jgi:predicted ferric reductase
MTVVTRIRTRTSVAPALAGRVVLVAAVAINLAIVWTLFFTEHAAQKNTLVTIGRFLGLHVALIMILQLVLIARLPWLDRRIGMDRLTSWHRWVGFTLLWTVILHLSFIITGYARFDRIPVLREALNLAGATGTLVGMLAVAIIVVAVAFSIRAARRRLQYETWHSIHLLLYAAVTLALIHQLYEGSTFKTSLAAQIYWWALWAFAIGALIVGRLVVPLWRNSRHRLRVAAVVPESDNTVSVYMTGKRLDRLPARPGQFFLWRFLGHNRWWQVNPFSLSAAPDGRSLRLTAKGIGTTSAGLRSVPIGTRVFAEGPYGAFTTMHRTRTDCVLIAGGVGVTPIRSLLEDPELTGDVVVLYRVHTAADAVLLGELENLATTRGARLHLLTGRTGTGSPPNNPFSPESLARLVPDIADRDVFVCGPGPMTDAVLRSLRALRVPGRQVHAERFRLAA